MAARQAGTLALKPTPAQIAENQAQVQLAETQQQLDEVQARINAEKKAAQIKLDREALQNVRGPGRASSRSEDETVKKLNPVRQMSEAIGERKVKITEAAKKEPVTIYRKNGTIDHSATASANERLNPTPTVRVIPLDISSEALRAMKPTPAELHKFLRNKAEAERKTHEPPQEY